MATAALAVPVQLGRPAGPADGRRCGAAVGLVGLAATTVGSPVATAATAEPGAQGVPAAGEPPMTALPVRMVRQDCFSAELTEYRPLVSRECASIVF
ncbi:hypothetical protein OSH53_25835 [Mycobacterium ulcerans]